MIGRDLHLRDLTRWDFGGGANPRPEYLIVDADPDTNPDVLWDLTQDPPQDLPLGVCLDAKFFHGPEHYSRRDLPTVLRNIHSVMARNGSLEIRCPDMDEWTRIWLEEGANHNTLGCIFGSQTNRWQVHLNGLNHFYLSQMLQHAGFTYIERASASWNAPPYPDEWKNPGGYSDPNKRFDLHMLCQKP